MELFREEITQVVRSMRNKSLSFRSNNKGNSINGIFSHSSSQFGGGEDVNEDDDQEGLYWAAIEMHPSYKSMRASILKELEYDEDGDQVTNMRVVDVGHLRPLERNLLIEKQMIRDIEQDNENFLRNLRNRIDR